MRITRSKKLSIHVEEPVQTTVQLLEVTPNLISKPLSTSEYRLLRQKQVEEQRNSIQILQQVHYNIVKQLENLPKIRVMDRNESAHKSALNWVYICRKKASLMEQSRMVLDRLTMLQNISSSTKQIALPCDIRDGYTGQIYQKKRKQKGSEDKEPKPAKKKRVPNNSIIMASGKLAENLEITDTFNETLEQKTDSEKMSHFNARLDEIECRKKILSQEIVDCICEKIIEMYDLKQRVQEYINEQQDVTTEQKEKITCQVIKNITIEMVYSAMKQLKKHLKLTNYTNVCEVWCRITGREFPRLTPEERDQACLLFSIIQPKLFESKGEKSTSMNYQCTMWHIFRIIGAWHMLLVIKTLKKSKTEKNIDIPMRKICEEYGWNFETISDTQEKLASYFEYSETNKV